jgi:hypothetical protein
MATYPVCARGFWVPRMSCFGFVPFWLLLFLLMRLQTVFRCFPPEFILSRRGLPIVPPSVSSILLPHSFLSRNPPCARFFLGTRPHSLHQETLPIPPEGRLPAGMCHLPTTNRPTLIISHVDPPAIRMRPQSSCFLPSAFWHSSGRGTHPSRAPMCVGVLGPRLLLAARSLPHRSVSLLSPSFHLPSAPIPFPYSPFSQPTACPSLGSDRTLSSLSGHLSPFTFYIGGIQDRIFVPPNHDEAPTYLTTFLLPSGSCVLSNFFCGAIAYLTHPQSSPPSAMSFLPYPSSHRSVFGPCSFAALPFPHSSP